MTVRDSCLSAVLAFLAGASAGSPALACYAVVAGKDATADGSVLVAHSELNDGPRFLNFRVIPRLRHAPGEVVTLQHGGTYPEPPESFSFLWSENFGATGSDACLNEWGVAVVSDATPTVEDPREVRVARGDVRDGGVGFSLRIEVAKRAKTARHGVEIVGRLVERFGYNGRGVTLVVADPREAWVVALVGGPRWLARRVPDDQVVVLANVNVIREVDLGDPENFLGSRDIVEYAVARGWHDPSGDRPFDFKRAYDQPSNGGFEVKHGVDARQWRGQCLVEGREVPLPTRDGLPFAVKPKRKLTIKDMRDILSDHLEGTPFDKSDGYRRGSPHDTMESGDGMICNQGNQEAAVFQLRGWLPPAVGCVYWRATAASCSGALTPWYLGVTETPESYYRPADPAQNLAPRYHFDPPAGTYDYDPAKAFWIFNELENLVDLRYRESIGMVREVWADLEDRAFAMQPSIESTAVELLGRDEALGRLFLTVYSGSLALEAIEKAKVLTVVLKTRLFGF